MKLHEILLTERVAVKGNYIQFNSGRTVMVPMDRIPAEKERHAMIFTNSVEDFHVFRKKGMAIHGSGDKHGEIDFKNAKELADFLNKNNFDYTGIDRR